MSHTCREAEKTHQRGCGSLRTQLNVLILLSGSYNHIKISPEGGKKSIKSDEECPIRVTMRIKLIKEAAVT